MDPAEGAETMTNQSRRDEMILVSKSGISVIPKGWYGSGDIHDTCFDSLNTPPSGLVNQNAPSIVFSPLRGLMEPS